MININNRQRKIPVNIVKFKKDTENILRFLRYPDFSIGILFTTNKTIQFYNNTYRKIDKPTDILSFPYHPELKAGERIKIYHEEDKNLGDIIISPEYVEKAAQKLGRSFEKQLQILLVHGICHLLGYDHIEDHDYRRMRAKEAWLLKKLNEST